jgi:hypothetical protein
MDCGASPNVSVRADLTFTNSDVNGRVGVTDGTNYGYFTVDGLK